LVGEKTLGAYLERVYRELGIRSPAALGATLVLRCRGTTMIGSASHPKGRYSRDRAKPDFWRRPWPWAGAGMALLLVILIVVLALR
jgi:hypothetical protein